MRTWKTLLFLIIAAALALPAAASAAFEHVVAPGESLTSVAAADGLSVDQLAAANGLPPTAELVAGTPLAIPPQDATGTATAAPSVSTETEAAGDADSAPDTASAPETGGGYLVQPGDTLSAIAARYGVSVDQLAAENGLDPSGVLLYGTTISVPGAGDVAAPGQSDAAPAQTEDVSTTVPSTDEGSAAGGPEPTAETVSPSEVGAIASEEGVPASLAEAIGDQESGFNNDEVSSTGATGVMQIEPGTWNYIGSTLAGPPPLQADSAADNIRAGTLLLHSLLNATGGNPEMAAAAYYQGLGSLQQHGMYADTQQYVNDVMALSQRFGGQ